MARPRSHARAPPPPRGAALRRAKPAGNSGSPPKLGDDFVVGPQSIVGMLHDDAERIVGEMLRAEPDTTAQLDLGASGRRRRWSARGVRHFLRAEEGEGYWDFFKLSDTLLVSVTDATYRKDMWVRVEGAALFKLRIILSGQLRAESGEVVAEAPEALLYVSPGPSREGYYTTCGEPIRMVVLHCRTALITHVLALDPAEVPPPLDALFAADRPGSRHRLAPGPEVLHAAQCILDSRYHVSGALRGPYLEALSMELLLQVLGDLANRELRRRTSSTLGARDLNRIYEARDYLTQHFVSPPKIPELARLVGVNQTKLKAGFRETVGLTIYDYVLKCRMERASALLMTGDYAVAEVAYEVGYEYPANFTHAFKKFHGRLPRVVKRRADSRSQGPVSRSPG